MASPPVPQLATARLVLRGHRAEDLADTAAMWADMAVVRHITGQPSTREEAWARLLRYVGHWALFGCGYWVVVEQASGAFVGEVGFGDFQRGVEPGFAGALEAGWVLAPWARGRGYATEAVQGALRWADQNLGRRMVCMVAPDNAPSLRVAENCGFHEFARTTYRGGPTILLERL